MSTTSPIVVLLGNVDHEGIASVLKTSGYIYQKKLLDSSRENWGSIVNILDKKGVQAVLAKLTPTVYSNLAHPSYEKIGDYLLESIAKKRNLVFIYDELWAPAKEEEEGGIASKSSDFDDDYYYPPHGQLSISLREAVNEKLRKAGIEPICYSTNAQLTVIGAQFLKDLAAKLLFRIYVPHGRLYATEIDKLLQLFKEFLDSTGREGITLNKVAAEHGTSFEFCGEYHDRSSLAQDFEEFSEFMEQCVSDVDKARTMLALREIDGIQATKIIGRYTKEARRLHLDIKHERELRILEIRHRLESELAESLPPATKDQLIRSLVDEAIPPVSELNQVVSRATYGALPQTVTINVNPQIIDRVQGTVINGVKGHVNLGHDAQKLIELITKYGGARAPELTADVHEVGDPGIPEGTRLTKKQRLKSFLYGLGPETAKIGMHLLEEYLKKKIH